MKLDAVNREYSFMNQVKIDFFFYLFFLIHIYFFSSIYIKEEEKKTAPSQPIYSCVNLNC